MRIWSSRGIDKAMFTILSLICIYVFSHINIFVFEFIVQKGYSPHFYIKKYNQKTLVSHGNPSRGKYSPDQVPDCPTGENSNETFEFSHCFGYLLILLKLFFSFFNYKPYRFGPAELRTRLLLLILPTNALFDRLSNFQHQLFKPFFSFILI
jgi:hypothetical protein